MFFFFLFDLQICKINLVCYIFQIGAFRTIEPEAIRAQDGDTGINVSLTYSISAGK